MVSKFHRGFRRKVKGSGHQRVRALKDLGDQEILCTIRPVKSEEEHETLLIEANIKGRTLKITEMARAIKRLYELKGVDRNGGGDTTITQGNTARKEIAKETNLSEKQVAVHRTIANLIPEFTQMLDNKEINQKTAYQIAQI